jgi:mono/diheme cytochrome c family protein
VSEFPTAAWLGAALAAILPAANAGAGDQDFGQVERGRYLTVAADCTACHTEVDSPQAFAGGRSIPTPFGSLISPNITPDRETGIGAWTDQQFEAALREGKLPDGRHLYPAMPYVYYTKLSHEDVSAIRAYLNTVPAVRHEVADNDLPFPYKRALMGPWNLLNFDAGQYKLDTAKSAEWNRGAYLVEGPGHCAACHTPKGHLGGDEHDHELQGYTLQGWFAPNITDDAATGLNAWSADDIAAYLKNGHNRFAAASGPMAEEVELSSSHMNDADLHAIAIFLKASNGQSQSAAPLAASDPRMVAGAAVYADLCSACHKADGTGIPFLFPNIAEAASVASREPTSLIHVVLKGAQSAATAGEPTAPAMPGFGWQLSDAQVAAVTTYVRNSWHHAAPAVSDSEVHKVRVEPSNEAR